jgi:NDP-sugar pyrophosphorylase family protein
MKHRRKSNKYIIADNENRDNSSLYSEPMPLYIIGAGEFLYDLISLIQNYPEYKLRGILDPAQGLKGQIIKGIPVTGWLTDLPDENVCAAIGTPSTPGAFDRNAIYQILLKQNVTLPIIRSPSAVYPPDLALRRGTILLPHCHIKPGAYIGENCLLAPKSFIAEGIELSPSSVVMPGQKITDCSNLQQPKLQPKSLAATLASKHDTIQEIMRKINWAAMEIMLVIDHDGALVGTITDGDIRRGILAGMDVNEPVSSIMNPKPITVPLGTSYQYMLELMEQRSINHLPVVDNKNRPVRLEMITSVLDSLKAQGAIVMAGGLGTRLRPLTNKTPKPLLSVDGQPILDHLLSNIQNSGLKDVIISVNYMGQKIRKHVGDGSKHRLNVNYLSEQKKLGTAGALSLLKPRPKRPFLVLNGDLMTNMNFSKLLAFQKKHKYAIVMCVYKQKFNVPYGVVEINNGDVTGLSEKPVYEHFVNASIYTINPSCIDLIPRNTFFDMPELINKVIKNGSKVGAFPIIEYWRDIGVSEDLDVANTEHHNLTRNTIEIQKLALNTIK